MWRRCQKLRRQQSVEVRVLNGVALLEPTHVVEHGEESFLAYKVGLSVLDLPPPHEHIIVVEHVLEVVCRLSILVYILDRQLEAHLI